MGKGIDAARRLAPEHAQILDDLKDQLLIVFLKRLVKYGDKLGFPVSEIDDTEKDLLAFNIDPVSRIFTFQLRKKEG